MVVVHPFSDEAQNTNRRFRSGVAWQKSRRFLPSLDVVTSLLWTHEGLIESTYEHSEYICRSCESLVRDEKGALLLLVFVGES